MPEGWAQDVVRPVGPFWLRSLPVPENLDVAPVEKSWRQICAHRGAEFGMSWVRLYVHHCLNLMLRLYTFVGEGSPAYHPVKLSRKWVSIRDWWEELGNT